MGRGGSSLLGNAHAGLAAVAIRSIATGAVLAHLVLDARPTAVLTWSIVVSNYAIAVSILVRGLAPPLGFDPAAFPLDVLASRTRDLWALDALLRFPGAGSDGVLIDTTIARRILKWTLRLAEKYGSHMKKRELLADRQEQLARALAAAIALLGLAWKR